MLFQAAHYNPRARYLTEEKTLNCLSLMACFYCPGMSADQSCDCCKSTFVPSSLNQGPPSKKYWYAHPLAIGPDCMRVSLYVSGLHNAIPKIHAFMQPSVAEALF